ncbi:MAG: polysaccharide biosynthesis tyrosine autokinase [Planctomycetes bacterium]|nr:polysaccharide biosynthesis tyrosine autokinase [Planctomycetota bacterium]
MEVKDYLRILRRRWWVVLIVSTCVCGVNYYTLQRLPVIYRASADVIIKQPTEQYVIVQGGATSLWESLSYETRLSLIKSEPVLAGALIAGRGRVPEMQGIFRPPAPGERRRRFSAVRHPGVGDAIDVREIKDDTVPEPLPPGARQEIVEVGEAAMMDGVALLKGMVDWDKEKDSEVVTIFVTGGDSESTGILADAMAYSVKTYIERDKRERVARTLRFIEGQIRAAEQEFVNHQQEIEQIRQSAAPKIETAAGPLWTPGDLSSAERSLGDLLDQQERLKLEIAELKRRIENRIPPSAPASSGELVVSLKTEEVALERQLNALERQYTESHPSVLAKQAELAQIRRQRMDAENRARRNAQLDGTLAQNDLLVARRQELPLLAQRIEAARRDVEEKRKAVQSVQKEIEDRLSPEDRRKFAAAEFQLELAKRTLTDWLQVKRDLQTQVELQVELVDLVAKAKPGFPLPRGGGASWPFIFIVGASLGIGAAYALEYLNTTIRSEHDVKRYVNIPLLGMILRIRKPEERILLNVPTKSTLHEIFNTIGTLVETYAQEHQARIFMVASSRAEEGKSTVTSNIGIALARSGARVILVDCDLRKAVLHRFFSLDNTHGLAPWLGESSEADAPPAVEGLLRPTEIEGLRVITAGPHPQNPVGLLKSDRFRRLLQSLREQADIVLIDVPPVNIAVDTMLLAPFVDGILLLICANETNKDEVAYAKRLVEGARGKFIGCILNKVTIESHGYYYYYYYYDSYKYYRER